MNATRRRLALIALVALAAAPLSGGGAEVYGKPLRGLTAVPLATVVASPEKFRDRSIRIAGVADARDAGARHAGALTLSDAGASLLVRTEGFSLPEKVDGSRVTAEGRLAREGLTFVATGAEVSR